jgi:hypothetical protein
VNAAGRAAFTFASDSRALWPRIFPIREPRMFIVVPLRGWRSEIARRCAVACSSKERTSLLGAV